MERVEASMPILLCPPISSLHSCISSSSSLATPSSPRHPRCKRGDVQVGMVRNEAMIRFKSILKVKVV